MGRCMHGPLQGGARLHWWFWKPEQPACLRTGGARVPATLCRVPTSSPLEILILVQPNWEPVDVLAVQVAPTSVL